MLSTSHSVTKPKTKTKILTPNNQLYFKQQDNIITTNSSHLAIWNLKKANGSISYIKRKGRKKGLGKESHKNK